jgi:hypothetical protein
LNSASKIGLAVESLLNWFNGKVSVSSVGDLPEGDLRITCKVNILRWSLIFLIGAEYTLGNFWFD